MLPGDPLRAKWIAETFFEEPRLVNSVRNCLGYTGTWQGKPISVQATGMGQPSTSIYVHELLNVYGAKTLIRVGTCGGLTTKLKLRDIVLGMAASTESASNSAAFHVGGVVSADTFYQEDPAKTYEKLAQHGVLAVEMESAALYTLAARFNARALTACAVSDCLITGAELNPVERQASLTTLVELALNISGQLSDH